MKRNLSVDILSSYEMSLLINGETYIMEPPTEGFGSYTFESCDIPNDGNYRFRYKFTYQKESFSSEPLDVEEIYSPPRGYLFERLELGYRGVSETIDWSSPDQTSVPSTQADYNGMGYYIAKEFEP